MENLLMKRTFEEEMELCKLSHIAAEVALREMAGLRAQVALKLCLKKPRFLWMNHLACLQETKDKSWQRNDVPMQS